MGSSSPAQYELQFSKWGERKNLSANEWRLVFRIADQYDQDGLKCAVYMNKQLVRPSILKKKRRVYCRRQEYDSRREVRGKLSKQFSVQIVSDVEVLSFNRFSS